MGVTDTIRHAPGQKFEALIEAGELQRRHLAYSKACYSNLVYRMLFKVRLTHTTPLVKGLLLQHNLPPKQVIIHAFSSSICIADNSISGVHYLESYTGLKYLKPTCIIWKVTLLSHWLEIPET